MAENHILGVDIGTSGCKSLLVDENGTVIASAYASYSVSTPKPGWTEQDPRDWWEAVVVTVNNLLAEMKPRPEISCIGLCGQMHGMVMLDKEANLVYPCILWSDQRTGKQCEEICEKAGGLEGLLKLTNNRMLTGYTGGKILWMRENEPSLYAKAAKILNPKDYIRYKMTGDYATDVSDASGTGLFNVRDRKWSYKLLDALDIPHDMLPKCFESTEVTGSLSERAAKELGLRKGIPVAGGGGDAVIQSTGSGMVSQGIIGLTIGTGGNVTAVLDSYQDNPDGNLQVFCNNMPGKWHVMGVMISAGGALAWLRDLLGDDEKSVSGRLGESIYSIFDKEASTVNHGSDGLLFLPYLNGERCPHADANARGAFIGLNLKHRKPHLIRSVLEGVTFGLKDIMGLFKEIGISSKRILSSGGGANSDLWRQIQADVFESDVYTVNTSVYGGAYGAALVAGAAVGIWTSLEEAAGLLQTMTVNSPSRKGSAIYNELYPIYRDLYWQLKDTYIKLSGR